MTVIGSNSFLPDRQHICPALRELEEKMENENFCEMLTKLFKLQDKFLKFLEPRSEGCNLTWHGLN